MRTDPTQETHFDELQQWDRFNLSLNTFVDSQKGGQQSSVARSFSGHERNRLFLQDNNNFQDVSLLSGLDSRNDCRGFAKLDFDRDGKIDVAVTGPLSPRLQIFKNEIEDKQVGNWVFVKLQGGANQPNGVNDASDANRQEGWSNRDGIGAKIVASFGGKTHAISASCGEGLACQNSRWLHIGIGNGSLIEKVAVSWPSGRKTQYANITAGSYVQLHEDGTTTKVEIEQTQNSKLN